MTGKAKRNGLKLYPIKSNRKRRFGGSELGGERIQG